MKPKYDLVIFDLDGTLVDSDEMIVQSMYTLYDLYRNGRRTPREEIYYFSGPPIRETLKKEFPDGDIDFLVEEFVKISWSNYDKYVKAYPHAIEAIKSLKRSGVKVALFTSKARLSTTHCLDVVGLADTFDAIITGSDVKEHKPSPEGIDLLKEHFDIKNGRKVLYIGDNNTDYLSARNADVDIMLVNWGPREIDKTLAPDYWLNDYQELEGLIDGKNL